MPISQADLSNIKFFKDESIITEEAYGIKIDQSSGAWSKGQFEDTKEYMKKFQKFEQSVQLVGTMINGDTKVEMTPDGISGSVMGFKFGKTGTIPTGQFECPQCHKKVDMLLKNGYCSKTCAVRAKATEKKAKLNAAGQKTLDLINKVQGYLKLMDLVLNLITDLPDLIKGKLKLPQEYRDYVTLRIDCIFLELKRQINLVMIMKNDALIELMKKLKFGVLDDVLMALIAPVQAIIQTVIQIQQALNIAMAAIIALLNVPMTGIKPQSYGWLMTAKSAQYAQTSGKLFIEIEPMANIALPLKNMLNNINTEAIEAVIQGALPPIQDFEYLMDPTAFKIRWNLSNNNGALVKKMIQMLEELLVLGADTFPRYDRLKLTNIWFVLSILTGWGPLSRGVYGDFIFHGAI